MQDTDAIVQPDSRGGGVTLPVRPGAVVGAERRLSAVRLATIEKPARAWLLAAVGLCGAVCGCEGGAAPAPTSRVESASSVAAQGSAGADAEVAATVTQVLAAAVHPALSGGPFPDVVADLKPLYDEEQDKLIWFNGSVPERSLEPTLAAVSAAGSRGLNPEDYDAAWLAEAWTSLKSDSSASDRALFDLGLSIAGARMLRAVHNGRVDPATMNWGYTIERKPVDPRPLLREVRQGKGLSALLDDLEPPFAHYKRARRTLADYRSRLAQGEPAPVAELGTGPAIKPGAAWTGVPALAERLRVFGDLRAADAESYRTAGRYAGALVDAVKSFQQRHGLEDDGVIGNGTIRTLNVTLAQRVRQIELAMERMRWLPKLDNRPNVFVNVPLFRLWATDPVTGEEPLRMNVVVGQSLNHKTPLFVEEMEYVEFRPYWNPPRGITVRELVPHQRRDPAYFEREQLEIVANGSPNAPALAPTPENLSAVVAGKLFVRQKPGPGNSLGLAKFIFPNDENVYMHGTPAQQLFSRARRDFSHGCIRLEDPARFAEWVLRDDPQWNRARIDQAMQGAAPTRVNLKQPLSVVLFYDTVHVNSEGVVFFVDDIYGHDKALDAALAQGYPFPTKS